MSEKKKCSFQSRFYDINEARCIIPLLLEKRESWFCKYFFNEENCPIIKKMCAIKGSEFPTINKKRNGINE